jgi:8-oxo-dGTP diphosphatase
VSYPAPATTEPERPSFVDFAFQLGYAGAYQLARAYWRVRRPLTHGALVTLWCHGQVLLVRNSYVPYYSAPGGYLHRGETARQGAVRELREEVGIVAQPQQLTQALELTHDWEGRRDHVVIFSLELAERPLVQVDYREVVEAFWFEPDQVVRSDVFPPLKQAIAAYARAHGLASS